MSKDESSSNKRRRGREEKTGQQQYNMYLHKVPFQNSSRWAVPRYPHMETCLCLRPGTVSCCWRRNPEAGNSKHPDQKQEQKSWKKKTRVWQKYHDKSFMEAVVLVIVIIFWNLSWNFLTDPLTVHPYGWTGFITCFTFRVSCFYIFFKPAPVFEPSS